MSHPNGRSSITVAAIFYGEELLDERYALLVRFGQLLSFEFFAQYFADVALRQVVAKLHKLRHFVPRHIGATVFNHLLLREVGVAGDDKHFHYFTRFIIGNANGGALENSGMQR